MREICVSCWPEAESWIRSTAKGFLGFLAVWMCAMLVFLLTDNYYALLVGMFLAMGASTLLNTSITLITPFILPHHRP